MPSVTSLSLLLLLVLAISSTSSSPIGINYGRIANNLPSPQAVVSLLCSIGVSHVKLYDANSDVLQAFADSGVELMITLPNQYLFSLQDHSAALSWVQDNVQPYLPRAKITAIAIGNEVFAAEDKTLAQSLLPAMESVHSALASLGLDSQIAVTTAHPLTVLATSFPPSNGFFHQDLLPYLSPLIAFHARTGSPFLINLYPFFAHKADPTSIPLDYALAQPNPGVEDPSSGLHYDNMFHAQVDAVRSAIIAASGDEGKEVEVAVSETGWPSAGDADEIGATIENARIYNGNVIRMVAEGKGTPMRPESAVQVYIFALFNENMKPGPSSEQHYGLFNPDGNPAYLLNITVASHCYRSGAEATNWSYSGPRTSTGHDTVFVSSAMEDWSSWVQLVVSVVAVSLMPLVLQIA